MCPDALIDLHCDTLTDDMYTDSSTPDTFDDPARTLLPVSYTHLTLPTKLEV